MKNKTDLKKLISQAQKGSPNAQNELYKVTSDELIYYCQRLCTCEQDAQDLVQETYLTAFQKLNQYRRDDNFTGWLHTIALHKYYNRIRDEKPHLLIDEQIETIPEDELLGPQNQAENHELQKLVMNIIENDLTEPQRIAVVMYYYDEKSVSEIAKELNCAEGTVKSRLYYSRKAIHDELEKHDFRLGGSVSLITAVLTAGAAGFTVAETAHAAILSSIIGSKAAKSVTACLKTKLIAGAVSAAIAGGAAAGIYHIITENNNDDIQDSSSAIMTKATVPPNLKIDPPENAPTAVVAKSTEAPSKITKPKEPPVSVPGGALVEHDMVPYLMRISIPENYSGTYMEKDGENKISIPMYDDFGDTVFYPDTFSGDEIRIIALKAQDNFSFENILNERYENVSTSEPESMSIAMDNSSDPDQLGSIAAEKICFTAVYDGKSCTGTAISCYREQLDTHYMFIFCDCSATRSEEYNSVLESIIFRIVYTYQFPIT